MVRTAGFAASRRSRCAHQDDAYGQIQALEGVMQALQGHGLKPVGASHGGAQLQVMWAGRQGLAPLGADVIVQVGT